MSGHGNVNVGDGVIASAAADQPIAVFFQQGDVFCWPGGRRLGFGLVGVQATVACIAEGGVVTGGSRLEVTGIDHCQSSSLRAAAK